ncbi:hypothetical protein [Aquimarina sp. RZ0]|uniref:hypothetical protein n=1 Tax=Aquimarina sp. RZ0 TaxID=2607730 RepID=UPI0011F160CF|nr:hypothetical protein [Aquimarina sp. RZ0]KAA1247159.1 hypothetical protein F0000_04425 [Aquimarina sp. RZ0]
MKKPHNIRITTLFVFLFVFFLGYTQGKVYKSQLETVYLNDTKEIVYKNTFSNYNQSLIASKKIDFRKEIKIAKKENEYLLFSSNKSTIKLIIPSYLVTIRKAANRSTNPKAFEIFLKNNLPQLGHQFILDNNLEELYFISRKDTFNGKINALPSFL